MALLSPLSTWWIKFWINVQRNDSLPDPTKRCNFHQNDFFLIKESSLGAKRTNWSTAFPLAMMNGSEIPRGDIAIQTRSLFSFCVLSRLKTINYIINGGSFPSLTNKMVNRELFSQNVIFFRAKNITEFWGSLYFSISFSNKK